MSAFTPDQTNTLRELGLCSVATARGNICDHAPFEDYPAGSPQALLTAARS